MACLVIMINITPISMYDHTYMHTYTVKHKHVYYLQTMIHLGVNEITVMSPYI